jgi:hypothetical protein
VSLQIVFSVGIVKYSPGVEHEYLFAKIDYALSGNHLLGLLVIISCIGSVVLLFTTIERSSSVKDRSIIRQYMFNSTLY